MAVEDVAVSVHPEPGLDSVHTAGGDVGPGFVVQIQNPATDGLKPAETYSLVNQHPAQGRQVGLADAAFPENQAGFLVQKNRGQAVGRGQRGVHITQPHHWFPLPPTV